MRCNSLSLILFSITGPLLLGHIVIADETDFRLSVTTFSDLEKSASELAKSAFVAPNPLPKALADLNYEEYREIQFKPEKAVWWKSSLPYCLETFHRGFVQKSKVRLFVVDQGATVEIPFSTDDFRYNGVKAVVEDLKDVGHAGVKIVSRHTEIGDAQEILTFLGASYFRGRTSDSAYGASARGLAVNIALPMDEEFPAFTDLWLVKPESKDLRLTALALMNSPTVCGAYQFILSPGKSVTRLKVNAKLYFREVPKKLGIAPVTSMWMWGDGLAGPRLDRRPAVHDSDGLLIRSNKGEWLWRALSRQNYPSVSKFPVEQLTGFGLLQRNREFKTYQDSNADYHRRPSVWIEPEVPWHGVIELLELPGEHEGIDSIGVYFIPQEPVQTDLPMELNYDVVFFGNEYVQPDVATAQSFSLEREEDTAELKVQFSSNSLGSTSLSDVKVDVNLVRAELITTTIEPQLNGGMLATVRIRFTETAPAEVRIQLMDKGKPVSEKFAYLCPDKSPTFVFPDVYTR